MSHWFEYFPGNHNVVQGMMFGIEMQTWAQRRWAKSTRSVRS